MAKVVRKKYAFANVTIRERRGVVEVKERRFRETAYAGALLLLPFVCIPWGAASGIQNKADPIELIVVVAIITLVPVIGILVFYRPPRVLRLYPQKRVAMLARRFCFFNLFTKWRELGEHRIEVQQARVITGQDSKTTTAAGGVVLLLMGPLGFLLSLMRSDISGEGYEPAFALIASHHDEPIAVLMNSADANQIALLYNRLSQPLVTPPDTPPGGSARWRGTCIRSV